MDKCNDKNSLEGSDIREERDLTTLQDEVPCAAGLQPRQKRKRLRGKRSNPAYVQISAYIRRGVLKEAKQSILAKSSIRDISSLIEQLLIVWLNDKKPVAGSRVRAESGTQLDGEMRRTGE